MTEVRDYCERCLRDVDFNTEAFVGMKCSQCEHVYCCNCVTNCEETGHFVWIDRKQSHFHCESCCFLYGEGTCW
jgi:hypothetical protein